MNPFEPNRMPIDDFSDLLYREAEVAEIRNRVECRRQTVLLGVEGVGKTSLLRSAFDRDYRIKKAKEGVLISPVTEFDSNLNDEEIYHHFAGMIINSAKILSQCNEREKMNEIIGECEKLRNEANTAQEFFQNVVCSISDYDYKIVMVVDNFELFTSSGKVTIKHHETLRKLLNFIQFIVATNYDLSKDSIAPGAVSSFFLNAFAGNEITLKGWSKENAESYIHKKLGNDSFSFSSDLIDLIYDATGGVPTLLNIAAHFAYNYISKNDSEEGIILRKPLYEMEMVQRLFSRWCKMFTPEQIDAVKHFFDGTYDNELDQTNLKALRSRGMLKKRSIVDKNGNEIVYDREYQFCASLCAYFCKCEGNMETAASKNPLKNPHTPTVQVAVVQNAEDLRQLREQATDKVETKKYSLEASSDAAQQKIGEEIEEYKKLAPAAPPNSDWIEHFNQMAESINQLSQEVESTFNFAFNQITNASTKDAINNVIATIEDFYAETNTQINKILKGI